MNYLTKIIEYKKTELLSLNKRSGVFKKALLKPGIHVIAEIKLKSPTLKPIKGLNYLELGKLYSKAGASAISILTDKKFFGGDIKFISHVREVTNLPILRKDFIVDELQIYES